MKKIFIICLLLFIHQESKQQYQVKKVTYNSRRSVSNFPDTLTIMGISDSAKIRSDTLYFKSLNPEKEKKENWYIDKLLPLLFGLLGTIVGAVITYLTQKKVRKDENETGNRREKENSINQIKSNLIALRFHLQELAYLAVDSEYQYYLSKTEANAPDKQKALDEHYQDYKYSSEVKTKIITAIAEVNTGFRIYHKCSSTTFPETTSTALLDLTKNLLDLKRAEDYPISEDPQKKLKNDINLLSKEYLKHLEEIETISNSLS